MVHGLRSSVWRAGVCCAALVLPTASSQIHVSPSGSDVTGDGSVGRPFATLGTATARLPSLPRTAGDSTEVILHAGTYELVAPIVLNETHGGTATHPVIIRAVSGETVTISGGTLVSGLRTSTGGGLEADLQLDTLRCLYVNGERRQRARTETRITGTGYVMNGATRTGIIVDTTWLPRLSNASRVDLHMQSEWRDAYVPVTDLTAGTTAGTWHLLSGLMQEVTTLNPVAASPSFSRPFYVENAPELLDRLGEWYFDPASRVARYLPAAGETAGSVQMVAPRLERLLVVRGSALDRKVLNLRISGLRFAHTAWNYPQGRGWYGWQAGALARPSNGIPPAAVMLDNAERVVFTGNTVENTAAIGLSMGNGVRNSCIEGCVFFDLGDAAISISTPNHLFEDQPGEQVCAYDTVRNNLIYKAGRDWYGAPGLIAYYVTGLQILHNHIEHVPYSGISLGWGWDHDPSSTTCRQNRVTGNRVVNYLRICRDGGGIYTLGRQPESYVTGNYFKDGHNDYAGLYFDEGSAYFTAYDNVIEYAPRWLHIWTPTIHDIVLGTNYATTAAETQRGTAITYTAPSVYATADWPAPAAAIVDTSGLTPPYRGLLTRIPPAQPNVAPAVRIRAPAQVQAGLADILVVSAEVTDDAQPNDQTAVLWTQGAAPGTISFDRADVARNVSMCFSVAGTYQVIASADDGAIVTSDTFTVVVTDAVKGTNWALGQPAAASTVWSDTVHPAADAVDGDSLTIWHPAFGDFDANWWSVDLGQERPIGRIEIVSRQAFDQSATRCDFIIEGAHQANFSDAVTIALKGSTPFLFKGTWTQNFASAQQYRYVRYARAVSGNSTIAELRVFGVTGSRVVVSDPQSVLARQTANAGVRCVVAGDGIRLTGVTAKSLVRVVDLQGRLIVSRTLGPRDGASVVVPLRATAHTCLLVRVRDESTGRQTAFGPMVTGWAWR